MDSETLKNIRHWLIDVEGTLVVDKSYRPVPGAVEWLRHLRGSGQAFRILTNNTTLTIAEMIARLNASGFDLKSEDIVSCQTNLLSILRERGMARARVLGPDALLTTLREGGIEAKPLIGSEAIATGADALASADLSPSTATGGAVGETAATEPGGDVADGPFALVLGYLTKIELPAFAAALEFLRRDDCLFLALHRNRLFKNQGRVEPGLGAWVNALEYASGREALISGKPAPEIFLTAARELGAAPADIAMVGDDPRADLVPARRLGMHGVFVLSGKYADREPLEDIPDSESPDVVTGSVADLLP